MSNVMPDDKDKNNSIHLVLSGEVTLAAITTFVLCILRLVGVINWPWIIIFSPILFIIAITLFIIVGVMIILIILRLIKGK